MRNIQLLKSILLSHTIWEKLSGSTRSPNYLLSSRLEAAFLSLVFHDPESLSATLLPHCEVRPLRIKAKMREQRYERVQSPFPIACVNCGKMCMLREPSAY